MELTPSQVKNLMRRGLRRLLDPELDAMAKVQVWDYFNNQCAYCGISVAGKGGDLDHLVSAALGGGNALQNRVLSCKQCNAVEKRDSEWESFLKRKCESDGLFAERASRIHGWIEQNGGHPTLAAELLQTLESEAKRATDEYDVACQRVREAQRHRLKCYLAAA